MFKFICEILHEKDISPPSLILMQLYREETSNTEPILFIVSPGSDPSREI